jgi:hypothetical protein
MKKAILFSVFSSFLIFLLFIATAAGNQQASTEGWKVGVSRTINTPEELIWMAGYNSRDHPSEGTLVDLWAKVLAIEDANGEKVVLVTTDLLGIPRKMSDNISNQIAIKYGLTRSQIILSFIHSRKKINV